MAFLTITCDRRFVLIRSLSLCVCVCEFRFAVRFATILVRSLALGRSIDD